MRAISLVNRLEFEFSGVVVRKGLALGDVDNDGQNELVVGNENGELFIFKEKERWQYLKDLGFISCVAVGDILNQKRNCLVVITVDGWCYIFGTYANSPDEELEEDNLASGIEQVDGQVLSGESVDSPSSELTSSGEKNVVSKRLHRIYTQRIPADCKDILLTDVDGDGRIELVVGLTDRVVRSYRWYAIPEDKRPSLPHMPEQSRPHQNILAGKLIALNKWECANQIGSITMHHSADGKPSLLIAQPGGTFMRIRCVPEDSIPPQSSSSDKSQDDGIPGSSIDYQFLGLSRMRNQNISTEILGDLKTARKVGVQDDNLATGTSQANDESPERDAPKSRPYAVATLDGTIMLVQDEIILWAIAVDHQVFALTKLDVTGNGTDDIVACAWDGQTYILDQDKNTVRFHLDEPVQAFESGYYNLSRDEPPVTCFVYVTFKNKIILYYDIPLQQMILKKNDPDLEELFATYTDDADEEKQAKLEFIRGLNPQQKKRLLQCLLYDVKTEM